MKAEICKWYRDVSSPLIFMIDDFCNVWVDTNDNGIVDLGEDWGYAMRGSGSSLVFLEDKILKEFPEVKVTFFIPVGERAGVIENPKIRSISQRLDCDNETKAFFRSVGENPRYEVAYHGTTHGIPGKKTKDFVQEWVAYHNLSEALDTTNAGREVFKAVFGEYPNGGKYCGYDSNGFSDDSIDQSGFFWWCRYSNVGLYENDKCAIGGEDYNRLTNFDIKYFGDSPVIDIPTTLNGSILTRILHPGAISLKNMLKRVFKPLLIKKKRKSIYYLIENKLVISIQEHIAPARVDGKRQMPNIFDDLDSLRWIFRLLGRQRIWYCTCSELAQYAFARDYTSLEFSAEDHFSLKLLSPCVIGATLTLRINDGNYSSILQPNGQAVIIRDKLVNIELMNGEYTLVREDSA